MICAIFVALPLSPYAVGQGQSRADCANVEELTKVNSELASIKKEFDEKNLEYAHLLNDAIRKSMSAVNAYEQCTRENSFLDQLVGNDCSREKSISTLMSGQVTRVSEAWKLFASVIRTRLMLITVKPACK